MKKLPIVILCALLLLTCREAFSVSGEVHILLAESESRGLLSGTAMTVLAKDKSIALSPGSYHVTMNRGKLRVGTHDLTMPASIASSQPMTWNGTRCYGQLTFAPAKDGFSLGNRLDTELYISGVLRAEMNPSWHAEALKAQAVLARTYAARNKGAHGAYDLCSATHCQAYKGATADDAAISAAVAATKGLILRHGGSTAAVYYHADSGGMVTRAGAVWTTDLPYLQPRVEPVSYSGPNTTWEATLPMREIQTKLAQGGISVGSVIALTPVKRDESSRVEQLRIDGSQGTETISGHRFRTLVGSTLVKSTLFEFGGRSPYNARAVAAPSPNNPAPLPAAPKADLAQMPRDKNAQIEWMVQNKVISVQEFMETLSKPELRDKYIEMGIARIKGEKPAPTAAGAPGNYQPAGGYTSPNLSMTPGTGASVTFYGRGYGHGVGLSQWGAKAMAEQGWSYDRILAHYFPGTNLTQ